jgi:DNA-binding NarL/FixJ family response regulator
VARLFNGQRLIPVIGHACAADELIRVVLRLRPQVVVMDVDLPVEHGIRAISELTRNSGPPPPGVVVLTAMSEDSCVDQAIAAGAKGYVLKGCRPEELTSAVRIVAAGGAMVSPKVATRLLDRISPLLTAAIVSKQPPVRLTQREEEILRLMVTGHSNADIAGRLEITNATVRSHLHHLATKLGVRDRAQVVAYAYRHNLVGLAARFVDKSSTSARLPSGRGPLGRSAC